MWHVLQRFQPEQIVNSIYEIDIVPLVHSGVKGVVTDLDNTLVKNRASDATPELIQWLVDLQERGLQVIIISNNSEKRVAPFAQALTVPYISRAGKPLRKSFAKALDKLDLAPHETVMVGDQLITDILGANRLGMRTVLVTPIARETDSLTTRLNRLLERPILCWLKKRESAGPS